MRPTLANTFRRRDSRPARPVREQARVLKLQHVLVPLDFSEVSLRALKFAVPLARQFGARLTIMHVVESFPIDRLLEKALASDAAEPWMKEAEARLALLAARLHKADGLKTDVAVRFGKPFDEITRAAKDLDASVIVLTTHGYTGLKHAYLGSTAERVVRHAPCPVLVVRR